ncbi:MAG TPA: redox-regulated ATPase YchF [Thermotogaceae bacterium]|nr:redox-regulated ATPase YchF [Thermotogaceae bacterium]
MPNAGKSTLFNALTRLNVPAESYPFCTIDPNIAVVEVDDERVDLLAKLEGSKRKIKPSIEFIDIAGLIKGASKGEGLGNKFLDQIRKVDAILHVVRGFNNPNIPNTEKILDPLKDIETVETELILADIETINRRFEKKLKPAKSGDKEAIKELELLDRLKKHLEAGNLAYNFQRNDEENEIIKGLFLLTDKPVIYVLNADENVKNQDFLPYLENITEERNVDLLIVNAKIEEEVKDLPDEEKIAFLEAYGIKESAIQKVILTAYQKLNLLTFFTANQNEARAWSIKKGSTAFDAAGLIHTDMQKGFIKVEVISFEKLENFSNFKEAREKGAVEYHGKDYIVKEGDVLRFLFKV